MPKVPMPSTWYACSRSSSLSVSGSARIEPCQARIYTHIYTRIYVRIRSDHAHVYADWCALAAGLLELRSCR